MFREHRLADRSEAALEALSLASDGENSRPLALPS
jgi:hypothetical protein